MPKRERELHLGLMFWAAGTHPSGWRFASSQLDAPYNIEHLQYVTQVAERAKFDFLFLGDKLATDPVLQTTNPAQMSRLEPFISGAALAAATSQIGIVVTANPTYYDPYSLARQFATLDHLSQGRVSWNIVTGADPRAAANFSRDEHWDTEQRYDWADEFVALVKDLWDTWEDEALADDGEAYVRDGQVRALNHRGQHLQVAGPLATPRSPQAHPVILHAGTSERSRELGAREADAIFTSHATLEEAQAYYADIKGRARRHGRADHEIKILPSLTPIVAATTEQAVAIYDQLNSYVVLDPEDKPLGAGAFGRGGRNRNLTYVSSLIGVEVRADDYEAAVPPEVAERANEEGRRIFREITRLTRRDVTGPNRITWRDLIIGATTNAGSTIVGAPSEIADFIETWFEARAADGFNVFPPYVPASVEAFADLVVPELQRRGLFRTDYPGATFRDHLGLERPANRITARRAAAAAIKAAV